MPLTLPATPRALQRRERLLAANRNLRINAGTGYWQAEITNGPSSVTVITRYELEELCGAVIQAITAP